MATIAEKKKSTKKKTTTKKKLAKKKTPTKKKPAKKKTPAKKKPAKKKTPAKKKPAKKKTPTTTKKKTPAKTKKKIPTKKKTSTATTKKKVSTTKKKTPIRAIKIKKPVLAKTKTKTDNAIHLFASETSQVVVQIKPSLIIHAILPPTKRKLTVDVAGNKTKNSQEMELKTPTLVMSQVFTSWKQLHGNNGMTCYCMQCNKTYRTRCVYYLHTIDLKKCKTKYIHGATYCVSNCDSQSAGGWMCFGGNSAGSSLRHANRVYWSSVFNNSPHKYNLTGSGVEKNKSLVKKMKAYKAGDKTNTDRHNIKWGNKFDYIFGKEYMASAKPTKGVFISYDKQLLADNPKAISSSDIKNTPKAIIGLANHSDGIWTIDLPNGDTISLSDDQVTVC